MKQTVKVLMEDLNNDETFEEFVQWWIETYPEEVEEIIYSYLNKQVNKTYSKESDDWYDFLLSTAQSKIDDYNDMKYQELKDSRYD